MRIETLLHRYDGIMDDSPLTFGQLIANARRAKGWTQPQLADAAGVSRPTISRWERDAMPGTAEPDTVRALCTALDIDPREAAVSLGYLTAEEIQPTKPLPAKMREILEILQDPRINVEDRDRWLDYLMFLRDKAKSATEIR